jgi:ribonuclease P protein component
VRTAQLEVRYLASPLDHARIGVIVPRYGHTAVERNVVKRRLRDLARRELLPALSAASALPGAALDVVIRATPGAYAASHATLRAALQKVAPQLPLLPHAVPQRPPAATGDAP